MVPLSILFCVSVAFLHAHFIGRCHEFSDEQVDDAMLLSMPYVIFGFSCVLCIQFALSYASIFSWVPSWSSVIQTLTVSGQLFSTASILYELDSLEPGLNHWMTKNVFMFIEVVL